MCTKRSVEGEVQIDEFEVFEGKEQNRIVKIAQSENAADRSK